MYVFTHKKAKKPMGQKRDKTKKFLELQFEVFLYH